jgi:hypothetical protein
MTSTPYANNLIEAAHGVRVALDNIESTQDIRGLIDAVNQACDRISELNAAAGHITRYLEEMTVAAKKELGLGGA